MRRISMFCLAGWLALANSPAFGQDEREAAEDRETEQKLEQARERLEEAAREVAELSAELGGGIAEMMADQVRFGMRRAMLGINIGGPEERTDDGVRVTGVSPGGPADEAGIEAGDVLVSLQGQSLAAGEGRPMRRLLELLREIEPGERVSVEYLRDGEKRAAEIEADAFGPHIFNAGLGDEEFNFEFEFPPRFPHMPHFFGQWGRLELTELTPELGSYFGTDEGLLVVRAPDNDALMLEDGDVIISIAGREPESPSHAMRILRSYQEGETLRIDILRKRKPQTLEFVMPGDAPRIEKARFRAPLSIPRLHPDAASPAVRDI